MFGKQKTVLNKLDNKTAVVVGLFERSEGLIVRFGRGKIIEEEIMDKKEKTFKVWWDDGTVEKYDPPPFRAVFLRDGGGPVVFYYIQSPEAAVPITSPTNAVKRLRFDSEEKADMLIKRLKKYNPNLEIKKYVSEEDGYIYVEFPVLTFDLDRDIPVREHYARSVLRLMSKSLKKGFWEKWGGAIVLGTSLIVMIVSFLLATGFVQQTVSTATQHLDKVAAIMEKVANNMTNALQYSNRLLETVQKLIGAGGVR